MDQLRADPHGRGARERRDELSEAHVGVVGVIGVDAFGHPPDEEFLVEQRDVFVHGAAVLESDNVVEAPRRFLDGLARELLHVLDDDGHEALERRRVRLAATVLILDWVVHLNVVPVHLLF